jgi:hypothetical protein
MYEVFGIQAVNRAWGFEILMALNIKTAVSLAMTP